MKKEGMQTDPGEKLYPREEAVAAHTPGSHWIRDNIYWTLMCQAPSKRSTSLSQFMDIILMAWLRNKRHRGIRDLIVNKLQDSLRIQVKIHVCLVQSLFLNISFYLLHTCKCTQTYIYLNNHCFFHFKLWVQFFSNNLTVKGSVWIQWTSLPIRVVYSDFCRENKNNL